MVVIEAENEFIVEGLWHLSQLPSCAKILISEGTKVLQVDILKSVLPSFETQWWFHILIPGNNPNRNFCFQDIVCWMKQTWVRNYHQLTREPCHVMTVSAVFPITYSHTLEMTLFMCKLLSNRFHVGND